MVSLDERFTQALHGGARAWRGAIERQLGVDGATLVATIDRLAAATLVERMPSPHDRRVKLVVPTARGKALAAEIDDFTAALRRDVMARIDSARLDVAAGVLEALRALLDGA